MQKIIYLILNVVIYYIEMKVIITVLGYLQTNICKISNAFILDIEIIWKFNDHLLKILTRFPLFSLIM